MLRLANAHRTPPTAAALTLVSGVALLVLLIGGLWFNARLTEQRNEALGLKELAEQEAAKAKTVRDFVVSIFQFSDRFRNCP